MSWTTNVTVLLVIVAALSCCHASTSGTKISVNRCELSEISVSTVRTGKLVKGQPQYQVTIENYCICPQFDIHVRCLGLPSVEPVDKSKISPVGDGKLCIVAAGSLIFHDLGPVTFTYAWKTPLSFTVVSAKPKCILNGLGDERARWV